VVAVVLGIAVYLRWFAMLLGAPRPVDGALADPQSPVGAARPHRGATAVLVLGTGILVLFSVFPGLLLGLLS
jgi:NADH-quinone oxidoreductase subunit N